MQGTLTRQSTAPRKGSGLSPSVEKVDAVRARGPQPVLVRHRGTTAVRAAALVLHGGREVSVAPVTARQLAVLRMVPIARHLAAAGHADGLGVWRLRFRYRGWNGEAAPVADVRWAVDQLRERHGDVPVVLVGHSMGGRAALSAADEPGVVGVVGLAPWVTPDEPYKQVIGRRLLVVHGTRDTHDVSEELEGAGRRRSCRVRCGRRRGWGARGRDVRASARRWSRDASPGRSVERPDHRFRAPRRARRAARRPSRSGNRGGDSRYLERTEPGQRSRTSWCTLR